MRRSADRTPLKRPLLWGGVAAIGVTAAALHLPWWIALAPAVALAAWFCWRRSVLCAVLTLVFLLTAVGYRHQYVDPTRHLNGQSDVLSGVIVEEPREGKLYTVRVTSSSLLPSGTYVQLVYYGEETPTLYATITAKVRLHAEERGSYFSSQGAVARAFPQNYAESDMTVTGTTETAAHRLTDRVRSSLLTTCMSSLGDTEGAILAAVCFGERSFLDDTTSAAFQGSGLSHLLVVSGLHVSMVALALRRLLRRLGRHGSCLLSLLGVWLFAWLVGFSPSVLRAATMCTLWLMGRWLFYRADGLNSWGLAAMVVLAVQPCAIWNGGAQLSFTATLGVLLAQRLTPRFETEYDLPWWRHLWQTMRRAAVSGAAVCLSALLFTLPIATYHYGGFSLTTVPANILAVAPVGGTMALGWLGTLCGFIPFLGWLSNGLLLLAALLARYVGWVAQVFSPAWAWISVALPWQWVLLTGLCGLTVCGILCRIPLRRLVASLCGLTVTALCVALPLTTHEVEITVLSLDNEAAFVIQQGDRQALLLTHGREADEALYTLSYLDPDVVFFGDATAADTPRLRRFPRAVGFATEEVAALSGGTFSPCPMGSTLTLWEGCRLTLLSEDWWLLRVGDHSVRICLNPKAPAVDTEDFCIFVGGTPTHPPSGEYAAVCSEAWLRRYRPVLTGRETCVIDTPITFVPQEGEWRVTPWL